MSDYWKEVEKISTQPAPTSAAAQLLAPPNEVLLRKIRSGVQWPWWMAGVSIINMILVYVEATLHFAFGSAFVDIVFVAGKELGPIGLVIAVIVNLLALAAIVVFGLLARKPRIWAYVTSLVLMVLDTAIVLWLAYVTESLLMLPIIVHLLAIWAIWSGLGAARLYLQRQSAGQA